MLKRCIGLVVATLLFTFQILVGSAQATEIPESIRTLPLNDQGDTATLSLEELATGKRLFNYACGQCHVGGVTKTNFNVDLGEESLALATPPRDNIEALVDYMQNPTTYDGLTSIAEVHPATISSDVFPKMRNLTEDDLYAIAGHILIQPKILGDRWGAGKTRAST